MTDHARCLTLGVDVGGTKALAVVHDGTRIIWTERTATGRDLGPDALLAVLVASRARAEREVGGEIAAVGIGFPGLVEPRSGVVRSSVILDGWHEVPLASMVGEALGRPCRVDNDVNQAARGERAARASRGLPDEDFLFMSIGTGVGGALVLDGRTWSGAHGAAGEVGHLAHTCGTLQCECGRHGCLATVASGRSIELRLGIPAGSLAAHADGGLPNSATGLLREAAVHVGRTAALVMNLLDLPLVVLGGGIAEVPGFVRDAAASFTSSALAEVASRVRIEPARAGYEAGAVGAALSATEG